jgi:hypothetical protein
MEFNPYEPLPANSSKMKYKAKNDRFRSMFANRNSPADGDFRCLHCRNYVVQATYLSGVQNRNHCPYCLWSRHVDLLQPGDRLAACKAEMRPVGLALKKRRKKYGTDDGGELMLIHQCQECGKLSINRIAADDLSERLNDVFNNSASLSSETRAALEQSGIRRLDVKEAHVIETMLSVAEYPLRTTY